MSTRQRKLDLGEPSDAIGYRVYRHGWREAVETIEELHAEIDRLNKELRSAEALRDHEKGVARRAEQSAEFAWKEVEKARLAAEEAKWEYMEMSAQQKEIARRNYLYSQQQNGLMWSNGTATTPPLYRTYKVQI